MTTLLVIASALQQHAVQHAPVPQVTIDTVRVFGEPPAGTIETGWVPHSIGGILTTIAVFFAISGLGSFAAMWRWLLRPVHARIDSEKAERERKVEEERKERERAIEMATERRDRRFDEIVRPETGLLALVKKDLTLAINGIGSNVQTLVQDRSERDGRMGQLENRMARSEDDRAHLHREFGELKTEVEKLDDSMQTMRIDVIRHIQHAKDETITEVRAAIERFSLVERRVDVIDDRTKKLRGGEVT